MWVFSALSRHLESGVDPGNEVAVAVLQLTTLHKFCLVTAEPQEQETCALQSGPGVLQSLPKGFFVLAANSSLVGILITIDDITDIFAISTTKGISSIEA